VISIHSAANPDSAIGDQIFAGALTSNLPEPQNRHVNRLATVAAVFLIVGSSHGYSPRESASPYRDSNGRFALTVPAAWKAQPLGDGVQIVRGDAYVSVMIFEHSSNAAALLEDLSGRLGKKWQRFTRTERGSSALSGMLAEAALFDGVNSQDVSAVLKVQCVVVDDVGYVLVTGYPAAQSPTVKEILTRIERSFTLLKSTTESAKSAVEPTIGVEVTDLTPEDAAFYHLDHTSGVLVVQVDESGPAAQAGLQLHDVILSIDGNSLESPPMLERVIASHRPGDVIELHIYRMKSDEKAERQTIKVTVGKTVR